MKEIIEVIKDRLRNGRGVIISIDDLKEEGFSLKEFCERLKNSTGYEWSPLYFERGEKIPSKVERRILIPDYNKGKVSTLNHFLRKDDIILKKVVIISSGVPEKKVDCAYQDWVVKL